MYESETKKEMDTKVWNQAFVEFEPIRLSQSSH
jgi:hypothetical protein